MSGRLAGFADVLHNVIYAVTSHVDRRGAAGCKRSLI